MENKWTLRGEGAELVIYVSSYERTLADNQSDANWLRCKVTGALGRFSFSEDYSIIAGEFAAFQESLMAAIVGRSTRARFATAEEGLGWDIDFNHRGQATVSGFIKSTGSPKTTLSFSFQSDQSYLQKTLSELTKVNQQFPIRTLPQD